MNNVTFLFIIGILISLKLPLEIRADDEEDEGSSDSPPRNSSYDDPVTVGTIIFLEDVTSFSVRDMNFHVQLFLEHKWSVVGTYCKRYQKLLNLPQSLTPSKPLVIGKTNIKRYWSPDTYFSTAQKERTPSKLSSPKTLKITADGDICLMESYSRLSLVIGCSMDIRHYPSDIQECPIRLRSYAYDIDLVKYEWAGKGMVVNPSVRLPQHEIKVSLSRRLELYLEANYTVLVATIQFIRKMSHHLVEVYAPSTITVVLSWFSFYLGLNAVPGRASLNVTCLLALVTQLSAIHEQLPSVSYVNGIDIWMVVSLAFVFAALLEFTIVKYIDRKRRHKLQINQKAMAWSYYGHPDYPFVKPVDIPELPKIEEASFFQALGLIRGGPKISPILVPIEKGNWKGTRTKYTSNARLFEVKPPTDWPSIIDRFSKVLFPLAFLVFNMFYWPMLLGRVY